MPVVTWNDSLCVGVTEIDQHHRHLVGLLNSAYEESASGTSADGIGTVFEELIDYATYHFAFEEQLMADTHYTQADAHLGEHERFIRRVTEIHRDYSDGRATVWLEVLSFLKGWLVNHIAKTDQKLGLFLKKR